MLNDDDRAVLAVLDERLGVLEARVHGLTRQSDYIEKSVDLCVNALRDLMHSQCPIDKVAHLDERIIELRRHRTDPAPPPGDENTAPRDFPTPEPLWRKP